METLTKNIEKKWILEVLEKIPPVWELNSYIAVNPFLGYTNKSFAETLLKLEKQFNSHLLPNESLLENQDIDYPNTGTFDEENEKLSELLGIFLSSYVDEGIAYWKSPWKGSSLWKSFQAWVSLDPISLDFFGKEKANQITYSTESSYEYISNLSKKNSAINASLMEELLNKQLGWSAYFRKNNWHEPIHENCDLVSFLAILCSIYDTNSKIFSSKSLSKMEISEQEFNRRLQLLKAKEADYRNKLISFLGKKRMSKDENSETKSLEKNPKVKFLFCIDVRSESLRRHLENQSPNIETDGFAGFFGMPIGWKDWSSINLSHTPALMLPKYTFQNEKRNSKFESKLLKIKAWVQKIKRSFPVGFHYVESAGFLSAFGLLSKTLKINSPLVFKRKYEIDEIKNALSSLNPQDKIDLANGILSLLGWKKDFPDYILITGHTSHTLNNPHEAGLACGACSGQSGELSALFATELLNDKVVREALKTKGFDIPSKVVFLPALHETVTDSILILRKDLVPAEDLSQINTWIKDAGKANRAEKQILIGLKPDSAFTRSKDWSEVFPEAGLANCASFVIAKRDRTKSIDLKGRTFLNSYDWKKDPEWKTLELLLTAPAVVASWINLQYYASTVAPEIYGAGNKLIHTIIGNVGVFEGNNWNLRAGLPLQSVYDGKKFIHTPVRLQIFVEAPKDQIDKILSEQSSIRNLVLGEWIHLIAINDDDTFSIRQQNSWENINP